MIDLRACCRASGEDNCLCNGSLGRNTQHIGRSHLAAHDDSHERRYDELRIRRVAGEKGAEPILDSGHGNSGDLNLPVQGMHQRPIGCNGKIAAELGISPNEDANLIAGVQPFNAGGRLRARIAGGE